MKHLYHVKLKGYTIPLLVLLSTLLCSCTDFFMQKVDVDKLPTIEIVPVLNAICGKDSVYFIALAQNKPVLGPGSNNTKSTYVMEGADVSIEHNGISVSLARSKNDTLISKMGFNIESSSFAFYANTAYSFEGGETYTIRVKKDGKLAQSTFTIPLTTTRVSHASIDSTFYDPNQKKETSQKRYVINLEWDADNTEEYFYVAFFVKYPYVKYYDYNPVTQQYEPVYGYLSVEIPAYTAGVNSFYGNETFLKCIPASDGINKHFTRKFYTDFGVFSIIHDSIEARIYKVDKTFYEFFKSSSLNYQASGDPFAEPVKVTTNVQGGLGIVAGYNVTLVRIPLK